MNPMTLGVRSDEDLAITLRDADLLSALDVDEFLREDVRHVCVTAPVAVNDPPRFIRFVVLLREVMSRHLSIEWTLDGQQAPDIGALCHLPPPQSVRNASLHAAMDQWRQTHRYGSFYYRRGPGFVIVRDTRSSDEAQTFSLDLSTEFDVFDRLSGVLNLETADEPTIASVAELVAEGIAVRLGNEATLLPYRMRRWPVPCDQV